MQSQIQWVYNSQSNHEWILSSEVCKAVDGISVLDQNSDHSDVLASKSKVKWVPFWERFGAGGHVFDEKSNFLEVIVAFWFAGELA